MKQFQVDLEKQSLIFSAAHFITFGDNICETLHGHNYRVRCRVTGTLNVHGYVTDFVALERILKSIVAGLDHKTLLPLEHPTIHVIVGEKEVEVTFEERRWVFPIDDCALLPIDNTTAERLAELISARLLEHAEFERSNLSELQVAVDENEGQWGVATMNLKVGF